MLRTLTQLPPSQQPRVLAGITARLLPDPGIAEQGGADLWSPVEHEILREVRQGLQLKEDDRSPQAKGRILERLAAEMLATALPAERLKQAKARLGQRGELRPDLYRVTFTQKFDQVFAKLGVRRKHAEEVIRDPDLVQHFGSLVLEGAKEQPAISLATKSVHPSSGGPFTLLVQSSRSGEEQQVTAAWRILHAEIDLSFASLPVDVLRRFLDVYGLLLTILGRGPTRLIVDDRVANTDIVKISANADSGYLFMTGVSRGGWSDVAIGYSVDLTRYANDLRRHGVPVTF